MCKILEGNSLKVFTRGELEKGYCQSTSILSDEEYSQSLKQISKFISQSKKICSISLTSSKILKLFDYKTIPSIMRYDEIIQEVFDPFEIWHYCKAGLDYARPSADFVVFNKDEGIAVVAYSKGAPVIIFEDDFGNIAIGTILRPQLIKYGKYLFNTILRQMQGDVKVSVPICSHYNYPDWGTIPDNLKNLSKEFSKITEISIGDDTETNTDLFGTKDTYNNAVVVW